MNGNLYIDNQALVDFFVTFIMIYIVVISGNTLNVFFDKKLSLNKTEILASSLIVTIIFYLLADYLLRFLSMKIFVLFVFLSSASSYQISLWFTKNDTYKSLIRIIRGVTSANNIIKDEDSNEKKKDKE